MRQIVPQILNSEVRQMPALVTKEMQLAPEQDAELKELARRMERRKLP